PIYRAYGASGPVRFVQECTTAGADTVVILHGINDIIHPDGINPVRPMSDLPTKEELIDGFRQYIAWARELGLRVYLCTILPIEGWRTYLPFREELRCAVNDWIRTQTEADGVVDFDLVMRREDNPSAMQEQYDSGDHLHPSAKGNQIMSDCVYEALFQNGGQNL
ncbi:MAG: GDSL-type esterase/lipase family protein, partial [Clostridia bacterium]|nr:GDSL-type esterase/lipase family protein [Clostridia bacterium]